MELLVKRIDNVLVPANDFELIKLQDAKLNSSDVFSIEITRDRNDELRKKFFAMIHLCFENQTTYNNETHLREFLVIEAGFYNTIYTESGVIKKPKSLKYSEMDDIEFSNLYNMVYIEVVKFLGYKCDEREILRNELNKY